MYKINSTSTTSIMLAVTLAIITGLLASTVLTDPTLSNEALLEIDGDILF